MKFYFIQPLLYQISQAEGRELPFGSAFVQEYEYRDLVGNLRLSFKDATFGGPAIRNVPTIVQAVEYDPFGLELNGIGFENARENRFKFQGKEKLDWIGWIDFGARMYDPTRGQFTSIDPMADKLPFSSPYVFCLNNPLKYIDPDGRFPWPVTVRSFISAQSAGGGLFYADNRGASFTGTSRVYSNFTVDPAKGSISKPIPQSNATIFYGIGTTLPMMVDQSKPKASITDTKFSEGSASFKFSHEGKDPITPSLVTPSLDVHAGLTFNENLKKGTLNISGSFSGDQFPSTEAFITDQSGKNKVFLGAQMEQGGVGDLYGDNKLPLFNVNMQVNFDKKGNFTGVTQGGTNYSVSDWNKKVQEEFKK